MTDHAMPGGVEGDFGASMLNAIQEGGVDEIKRLAVADPVQARRFFSDAEALSSYPAIYYSRRLCEFHEGRARGAARSNPMELIETAMEWGWRPTSEQEDRWRWIALSQGVEARALEWLLDRGFLARRLDEARDLSGSCAGLIRSFSAQSAEDLRILRKLVESGAMKDELGQAGLMDFLCESDTEHGVGQFESAKLLAGMGFKPRRIMGSVSSYAGTMGALPVPALMESLTPRDWPKGSDPEEVAREALRRLDWLESLGVDVAVIGDLEGEPAMPKDGFVWDRRWAQVDPFAALAAGRCGGGGRPDRALFEKLARALVDRGVDPNATGGFLAALVDLAARDDTGKWRAKGPQDGWERVDFAMGLGADPARHPGVVLSAAMAGERAAERMMELGADPAKAPSVSTQNENPVARAFVDAECERLSGGDWRLALGWRMAERGASLAWRDSKSGQTLLHRYAGQANKAGVATLARLLAAPEVKAQVNARSFDAAGHGHAPLHVACAALSLEAAKALLGAGADVNLKDARGWTPLRHLLRSYGEKAKRKIGPIADLLLEAGADASIPDDQGKTPAQAAAGKAPVATLAELLRLRPEDVLGDGAQAKKAKALLAGRDAGARSLLEKVELAAISAPAAEGAEASKPRKARRAL